MHSVEVRPLVAATLTPPLASGEANALDLKLRLLRGDPERSWTAEDDNSAPDGRNARMLFPVGAEGVGSLEITRQSDVGGPFEIVFLDPYDAWLLDLDVPPETDTSPDADPDFDRLSNWFEYAIGSDPFQPTTAVTATRNSNDPTQILFHYPQRSDHAARGIAYTIEVSDDLAVWRPTEGGQKVSDGPPGIEHWQLALPVDESAAFVRMTATTEAP